MPKGNFRMATVDVFLHLYHDLWLGVLDLQDPYCHMAYPSNISHILGISVRKPVSSVSDPNFLARDDSMSIY